MSSWQLIGLAIASRFDKGYAWAKKPVKINMAVEPTTRPIFTGAEYFLEQLEQKRLMEQATENLYKAITKGDFSKANEILGDILQHKTVDRIQNILTPQEAK